MWRLPGLWPAMETNEHKKRKSVRSWAAHVNCPPFSGIEQAVQTSAATSPTVQSPSGVPYIWRHQGPEKQVTGGVWRVTDLWLKQRQKGGGLACTFPCTSDLFPRNTCIKPLQYTHTQTHHHYPSVYIKHTPTASQILQQSWWDGCAYMSVSWIFMHISYQEIHFDICVLSNLHISSRATANTACVWP